MKKPAFLAFAALALVIVFGSVCALAQESPPGEWTGKRFEVIDTNNDGKVSKSEYTTHCEKRFDLVDKNGDGYVDKEEAQEAASKAREGWKKKRSQSQ